MLDYIFLYLIEAVLFIVSWITGLIYYKINQKGIIKYMGITAIVFIIVFLVTFIFEKPYMKIEEIENLEVKSQMNIETPTTYYHFQNITNNVKTTGTIDLNKVGEYNLKFEVDTLMGKYEKNAKVKVVDTTAPEIELVGEQEYEQSYKSDYMEPGFTAKDKNDGTLTEKVTISKEDINNNEYYIKYEVEDSSGNKAEKKRHIIVIDDIAPEITLNGSGNIVLEINTSYQEQGAKAVDEIDGDLSDKITIEGTVDSSKEGNYTITYKVSDKNGNQAVKNRVITIGKFEKQDGTSGEKGVVYLTFDDGPSSNITPKILDILKEKGVKATFFILNYDEDKEKLVKREYEEGHTVAIHGYSHEYSKIYQSIDAYMNNILSLQEKIKNSIGYNATITRFPGGSSNTISRKYCPGIMTELTREMVARGFTYFDWNVDSNDAGNAKNSEDVYKNVTKGLKKERANVVLMHDFSGNTKTLDALSSIIDFGLQNGYTFKKITEDTPMVTHSVNN